MKKRIFGLLVIVLGSGFSAVSAMTNGTTSPPAPYTGGASVVKVLYPNDGSTVTITATGAVIKQSPGHTAYREGWINPCNINSINVSGDLSGQIKSGSSNPYGSASACNSSSATNSSTNNSARTSTSMNQTSSNPSYVQYSPPTQPQQQPSQIVTAGSTEAPTTSPTPTSLPNTGPAQAVPVFGVSTILGTVGHFVITRRRKF